MRVPIELLVANSAISINKKGQTGAKSARAPAQISQQNFVLVGGMARLQLKTCQNGGMRLVFKPINLMAHAGRHEDTLFLRNHD